MSVHPSRETIFAALFTLIKTAASTLPANLHWKLSGRKLIPWDKVTQGSQPAMFLRAGPQDSKQVSAGLPIQLWRAQVWIYFRVDQTLSQTDYASKSIFAYIDAIENALSGVPLGEQQTLNNMVNNCWIDGTINFHEGEPGIDNQAILVIPISISVGI